MEKQQNRILTTPSGPPARLLVMPSDDEFGPQLNYKRLRARLYEEHIGQGRFAAFIGISGSTFCDILLGRDRATLRTRFRLAYAVRSMGLDDGTIVESEGAELPPLALAESDGALAVGV